MLTAGSITREKATQLFPFLAFKYRGRRKEIKRFTHTYPEFVFWIYPNGDLFDAKNAHKKNVPKGFKYILEDKPNYGGFLRGRLARQFEDQLLVVYCEPEILFDNVWKIKQFLKGIQEIPVPIAKNTLVVSDNGDIYGTITDIEERLQDLNQTILAMLSPELLEKLEFQHNGKAALKWDDKGTMEWGEANDLNVQYRFEFIQKLYANYTEKDKELIRFLLAQEIQYAQEFGAYSLGLNLSSFMLYTIMDINDVPLLFDAKFETCFDAQMVLDIDLILGFDLEETKTYFTQNPDPEREIVEVIEDYEKRHSEGFRSREEYLKFYIERRIPALLESESY